MAWTAELTNIHTAHRLRDFGVGRSNRRRTRPGGWYPGEVTYTQSRLGDLTVVTAAPPIQGPLFYHWFVDGLHVSSSRNPELTVLLDEGERASIRVVTTHELIVDIESIAPVGYPSRRTLRWNPEQISDDAGRYRVRQQREADGYSTIGEVAAQQGQWSYSLVTPRLDDLTSYTWQIVPIDIHGNEKSALTVGPELIVRVPDAPDFDLLYDDVSDRVTFIAAT